MLSSLLIVAMHLAARDAWTTGYVVDPPKEWDVGRGDPVPFREVQCEPNHAGRIALHSVAVEGLGVVCETSPRRADGVYTSAFQLQLAGGWSRDLDATVVQLVALPRERVAVFFGDKVAIIDARTGKNAMPPLALHGWPSWAAAEGEVLIVRMHNEFAAIDTSGTTLEVLWHEAAPGDRRDERSTQKCGDRWVDVVATRDFRGDFAETRAIVSVRVLDARLGFIGEKIVANEKRFFDLVSFEFHCGHTGRLHVVGRWIILD